MFTAYVKNLNDMVFSTSESPEEQQSTGVLGRIGSWLSPWRGKGPTSPTESASPTNDQALKSDGEQESEESVRLRARTQEGEEEKDQSSNPNSFCLSRDVFPCEEEDATQSAHRGGSVVSSTETAGGGPKKEESVEYRKKRVGQGKEREKSSNGTLASGNSEANASQLTHLSDSSEQGVVWESDQAHTQPQAKRQVQAGRRLHVYLEETSVTHCDQNTCAGQDVVQVTKKNLKVLAKAKSSPNFDLSSSSTSAEDKRTNVSPAVGAQSYFSALVGLSLKSHKESHSEPAPEGQTEANSMGRKNAARRKVRKNSQGDEGNNSQEQMPPSAQPVPEGIPPSDKSVTSPQGKSLTTHMGEASINSSSKHSSTSQTSPEGAENKTSCPDTAKLLDNFQDSNSNIAATAACAVDVGANMEDDSSLYKVERKTETPESKRRSLKVSRSEVKLFTKNVPLNSKQNPAGDAEEFKAVLKNDQDETKDKPKTEIDARLHKLKKIDEEPKPGAGRIADKISLFECPTAVVNKRTFQSPRSADVSPVRKATTMLKADLELLEKRSRSAERTGTDRSGSVSPSGKKPMTIKERVRNFTKASETGDRQALPQKPDMTGISQKATSSVVVAASKSLELDNQGKLDTEKQIQQAKSEITLKPDGQGTAAVGVKISISKEQPTDSKTNTTVASKTANQGMKPNRVETNVTAIGPGDSAELTDSISPQSKGPSRTGSRSKRRKGRDPTCPISPNSENKPDYSTIKPELTAIKQQHVDEAASASKLLTAKVSLPSDKAQGNTDASQKAFKKGPEVLGKPKKQLDSSFKKENVDKPVNRQEGMPEPSVSKDEPDTAACSSGTKTPIDKDPVILPQKDQKAGVHSLGFTQRTEKASKDSRDTSASSPSPALERPIEKTGSMEQEPPVEQPKIGKELSVQSESTEPNKKNIGQTPKRPNKNIELINQESKDVGKLENVEGEKTNQTEKKNKEKAQQLLHSDNIIPKAKVSESRHGISETEWSTARDDERKNAERKDETQPAKVITKPEITHPKPASPSSEKNSASSDLPAQKQGVRRTKATHIEKAAVCAVTQTNEAVSVTKTAKGPSKGEKAATVPSELQTKSTESLGTEPQPVGVAAKPQPHSLPVEKTENSPDDSCAIGANDAQFPSSKLVTKATTVPEKVSVKAADDTPVLTTAQTDNMSEKESYDNKSLPFSASKSLSSNVARRDDGGKSSTVKSVPSEVSGDITKLAPRTRQCEESKNTGSTSDITSLKGAKEIAQSPSDGAASNSTVDVVEKKAEKTFHSLMKELSPVANGDTSPHPQLHTVKKEPVKNKPSQTPKAPTFANMSFPDTTQLSNMKKLHFPQGRSKDDSATGQDAPSSWLDVDFPKRKLKVSLPKLSNSGSESNLLDTSGELDDNDFIEKIKKLCAPFSLPPRKHNPLRPPQPPFAMPAIREARFEKTFDPDEFKFGLSKKNQFSVDTSPSLLASKYQSKETKSGMKPARASLTDRSMLLSILDPHSRLRDNSPVSEEEDVKEERDDKIKLKSRLEGSCVLSSLNSSNFRGRRNGVQTQVEGTHSGDVSPSEAPELSPPPVTQPPPPSPTATIPLRDTLGLSNREKAQPSEAVVSDSGLPLPLFNDIKLPDYLEKYLPQEPAKPERSIQGQERVRTKVIGMKAPVSGGEAVLAVKPGRVLPDAVPPCFPEIPPIAHPTPLRELKQPPALPQARPRNNITAKGFHKRPGKMVLFEKPQFSGQAHDICRDVADATSLQLSPLISVQVVRGCWVIYEKPDFQGRSIALEEGGIELTNMWAEPGPETEPQNNPPMLIGSIRLAVWDYSLPHIDLFTEPEGHGRLTPYHDDTIETGSFGVPLSAASIQVHSGVWLVFSDPGFQGMVAVLETGEYPVPDTWGFTSPFVGSLRPLKMGGFKVENPNEVKALVYEQPGLEGACLEIDSDIFSFCESEGDIAIDGENLDSRKLKSVGSLKIIGGLWVGYSEPGFEGQQYILEEGEYLQCSDWGGSDQLGSLRPILAEFMSPHLKMFSDKDFGELGVNIDITVPVIDMDGTGYGVKTQSIDVINGVWVVFEEPGFCGECYLLEKGLYGSPEDWGASQPRVASAMPVVLDDFENAAKFKVQLFSDPGFQGSVVPLEDSVASLTDSVASCKVLAGSWLAFDGQDFSGRMYVLEVGNYPDLRAMGCVNARSSILSLQTVGFLTEGRIAMKHKSVRVARLQGNLKNNFYFNLHPCSSPPTPFLNPMGSEEFSLPSITLFERCGLWGKRVVLTDGSVNLQLAGGCSRVQSVLVEGGMWVLYEGINYRGPQILLKPGEVPDWRKCSSWQKIGSLRPLIQKRVHFRLRNRQTGLLMSVTGDLDDVKLMRVQETEETDGFEQIWFYDNGHLHCKLLEECCLSPSGSVTIAGSRVGLSPEPDNQDKLWSITPEGFIRYTPTADLVLDVKGGNHYDKNQVILNKLDPNNLQQQWDVDII